VRAVAIAAIVLATALPAGAQDTVSNVKNGALDTSVPESPAFTLLGLSPSTVTRPAAPRGLASSLLNGVDKNGNIQSGLALDTAPYMLLYGNKVLLQQYRDNRVVRVLTRTQLSVATTRGTSDADKSARVGLGANVTIFDKGDPRANDTFLGELAGVAANALGSFPPLSPLATEVERKKRQDDVTAMVEKNAKPIREAWKKKSWNRSSWTIAGAHGWISEDGTTSNLQGNGSAAWTSLAYGFETIPGLEDNAQVIVHARYHSKESVPDPAKEGTFYEQRSTVAGVSLRAGTADTNGSFEVAYVNAKRSGLEDDTYLRLTFVAERQLSDNVWLHVSVGGEGGHFDGRSKMFTLGAFKWATGPK
jgi:hypothetical protein